MTVDQGMQPHPAYEGSGQVISGEVVLPGQNDTAIALPEGVHGQTGLEGLGIEEIPTPRIKILHAEAMYEDNQTQARFEGFNAIILGLVRQRAMFPDKFVGDGKDVPLCKSNDAQRGLPNVDPTSRNQFPWAQSNFDPNTVPVDPELKRVILPCASCNMKNWSGSDNRTPPSCSDVWNLVIMYDPYGTGQAVPAFLALKRSALRPARAHLAQYKQMGKPAFTDVVSFELQSLLRGTNPYAVPVIKVIGKTDPDMYASFAHNYEKLADWARQINVAIDDSDMGVQQEAFSGQGYVAQPQQEAQQQYYPPQQQATYQQQPVYQQPQPAQQYATQPQQAPPQVQQQQYQAPPPVTQAAPPPVAPQVPTPAPPAQTAPVAPVPQQFVPPVLPAVVAPVVNAPAPPPPAPVAPQVASPVAPTPVPAESGAPGEPAWAGAAASAGTDDEDLPF